jgi:O-antigen/teichoic acid export membrane protein
MVVATESAGAKAKRGTRRQLRGSSLLLAGRMLSKALNFGIQVLIVRYLARSDFGAFAYALGVVSILQTAVTFGLDRAVARFVPIYHEQGDVRRMFGTMAIVVGVMAALSVISLGGIYAIDAAGAGLLPDDPHGQSVLHVTVLLAPLHALDGVIVSLFAAFASPRAIFLRKHVIAPCLKLAVIIALIASGAGVLFLAAGYVVAELIGILFYMVLLLNMLRKEGLLGELRRSGILSPWREVLSFTIPLLTSDLVYVAIHATNTLLLEHFHGTDAIAGLRAVQPAALMNQVVFASFAILFTPQAARLFARTDARGMNDLYWQTAAWVAVLSFPVFALTFSLAEPFTVLVYGAEYQGSGTLLALLALGYYFNSATGFNGLTLKVFGKVRYVVWLSLISVVVNVAAAILLVPSYGALGAALATAITLVVHNLLKQAGLRMNTGVQLFDPRYLRAYATIALAALGLLLVQWAARPPDAVSFVLAVVASIAVVRINRRLLDVEQTLPEILRVPMMRAVLGS